jgi:hypothetical protein
LPLVTSVILVISVIFAILTKVTEMTEMTGRKKAGSGRKMGEADRLIDAAAPD